MPRYQHLIQGETEDKMPGANGGGIGPTWTFPGAEGEGEDKMPGANGGGIGPSWTFPGAEGEAEGEMSGANGAGVPRPPGKMLGANGAGRPPAWLTDPSKERPAGQKTDGSATFSVYTPEQQKRLGVDEHGAPSAGGFTNPNWKLGDPIGPILGPIPSPQPKLPRPPPGKMLGANGGGIGPSWTFPGAEGEAEGKMPGANGGGIGPSWTFPGAEGEAEGEKPGDSQTQTPAQGEGESEPPAYGYGTNILLQKRGLQTFARPRFQQAQTFYRPTSLVQKKLQFARQRLLQTGKRRHQANFAILVLPNTNMRP